MKPFYVNPMQTWIGTHIFRVLSSDKYLYDLNRMPFCITEYPNFHQNSYSRSLVRVSSFLQKLWLSHFFRNCVYLISYSIYEYPQNLEHPVSTISSNLVITDQDYSSIWYSYRFSKLIFLSNNISSSCPFIWPSVEFFFVGHCETDHANDEFVF